MSYIVSYEELQQLKEGTIDIDKLAIPENIALLTWRGVDVKEIIEQKLDNLDIDESIVNDIKDRLDGCCCGDCVDIACQDWIDDIQDKLMREYGER